MQNLEADPLPEIVQSVKDEVERIEGAEDVEDKAEVVEGKAEESPIKEPAEKSASPEESPSSDIMPTDPPEPGGASA